MHHKISGIIHFFLVLAVISMGLPRFMAGDLNRNQEIDLADAIIGAKNFAQTADNPSEFITNVKNAVSAMHRVAGLETKIKSEDGKNTARNIDQNFLVSGKTVLTDSPVSCRLPETTTKYRSIHHLPQIPPPRPFMDI